jgi:hypothetical protein
MKLSLGKVLVALGFGFGAIAAPAAFVLIEATTASPPEVRDVAYARTLLRQGRLAWEDQQTASGASTVRGYQEPEPGSGN